MLLKLEQKGLICLPARQRPSNNRRSWRPGPVPVDCCYPSASPIECQLSTLEPISIVLAQSREEVALFDWLLWRYHYLPYSCFRKSQRQGSIIRTAYKRSDTTS